MNKISEHQAQAAFFRWAEAAVHYPRRSPLALLYAIPNAAKRSKVVASMMKAEGLRSGVPDVCLPWQSLAYASLRLEFKVDGGQVKPTQRWWLETLAMGANLPVVVWGTEDAITVTEMYLDGDGRLLPAERGYLQVKAGKMTWTPISGSMSDQIAKWDKIEQEKAVLKIKARRRVLK